MELEEHPVQVSCDSCGTRESPLQKLSLGKDFFARPYDRLSPSSDVSPKWYCVTCSMHKNLQRDFRDIEAELAKWAHGDASEMQDPGQRQRAELRLREISLLLDQAGGQSPFLDRATVTAAVSKLETRLASSRGGASRPAPHG